MFENVRSRFEQGYRTSDFPKNAPSLSPRYRGLPVINSAACKEGCKECVESCPVDAITIANQKLAIDLGRCVFCGNCEKACPQGAITITPNFTMAARQRSDLVIDSTGLKLAEALDKKSRDLFGHSLKLRQVSAGGCNGCEAEIVALSNVVFDMGRFGIQIVASPRHADGLLITGPVTQNMETALKETYEAVPDPKIVVAIGACAISGGPFRDSQQVKNGAASTVPVDLFIAGCPPHPYTIMDGLLRLLGRIKD